MQTQTLTGDRTIPFEVSSLPQGIYLVEIKTNTEKGSVKVIKK
ncbi:T9SS type A sorting domain-containing protein [Flavobacterium sp. J27]